MDDQEYWDIECKFTETFLELCSQRSRKHTQWTVQTYLNTHPHFEFTEKDRNAFNKFVGAHPVLKRLIYYTYSPIEETDMRLRMIEAWRGDRSDSIPIQQYTSFEQDKNHIYIVMSEPEIQSCPLLKEFLLMLCDNSSRVMMSDIQKSTGTKCLAENLRYNIPQSKEQSFQKGSIEQFSQVEINTDIVFNSLYS